MDGAFDLGAILAGLGFFLLGMQQLESSLHDLAGRRLKRFIRQNTSSPLRGVLVGTTATAMLQSSSLVMLLLLAFVGAGILTLGNAIGVVFGVNLGTTITGWLVALVGFKLDLEAAAFPLIGVSALATLLLRRTEPFLAFARLALALGFLLLGLGLMKDGVAAVASGANLAFLAGVRPAVFALAGLALTAVIQSSSAAMLIALSALSAGVVDVPQAAGFAVGANLGTTVTVMMGALGGTASKRRVAISHVLFNAVTAVAALILLRPLLSLIVDYAGIADPLFALVAFHSAFNLLGIALFLPVTGPFAAFLQRRFAGPPHQISRFINQVPPEVPDAAVEALELETGHLFYRVMDYNLTLLGARAGRSLAVPYRPPGSGGSIFERADNLHERYADIKELGGEILDFTLKIQEHALGPAEAARLIRLQSAVRHAVQSAKCLKDIQHNLRDFESSVSDSLTARHEALRQRMIRTYDSIQPLWSPERSASRPAELEAMAADNRKIYEDQIQDVYQNARRDGLDWVQISTLLNVNRELYASNKSLISALREYLVRPGAPTPQSEPPDVSEQG